MRYIDLDRLYVPSEWVDHAAELVAELDKMTPEERSEAMKKSNYAIWRLLNKLLSRISYGKCFYAEVEITGAGGDVEHYRPKLGVQSCDLAPGTTHLGYWWLAYLVKNLRFSSQTANRQAKNKVSGITYGKGTRFPLRDATKRATCDANLPNEEPLLLDPTDKDDFKLLGFNDAGEAVSVNDDESTFEYQRVEASIVCYNLNEQRIKKKRGDLCLKAKTLADKLDELEAQKPLTKENRRKVIETKIEIYEMVQPEAEFSSAVRYVLQPFTYLETIKEILSHSEGR